DGVVDENTDGERQPEQRHRVEREAEDRQRSKRREHGYRQRQTGDHRRAPRVEEEEHDQHGQDRAHEQRLFHVAHGVAHAYAGVANDLDARAWRQCLLQTGDSRSNPVAHRRRAELARLHDVQTYRLHAVEQRRRFRFGSARLDVGNLTQRDQLPISLTDNELTEVLRSFEAALQPDRALLQRRIHLTDGCGEILRPERRHYLIDADAGRGQIVGTNVDVELRAVATDDIH